MKHFHALIAFILALLLFSCKKHDAAPSALADGTYSGTFKQLTIAGSGPVAHVTLQLANGHFSGSSDRTNYPAICSGTYTVQADTAYFINSCSWPANVDPSVILSNNQLIVQSGDSLTLESGFTDNLCVYTLKRK